MSVIKAISVACAISACIISGASAADMFPPEAPALGSQEKLEFGTGWYLRGDITWAREKTPSVFPDLALASKSKQQNSWSLNIGPGYKFNNWFRADMTYNYFKQLNVATQSANFTCYDGVNPVNDLNGVLVAVHAQENSCYSKQTGSLGRHTLLFNGYLDLGTWAGVTPYVGAGVGTVYSRAAGNYDWYTAANGLHYGPTLTMPNPSPLPELWMDNNGVVVAKPITQFGVQDHRATISRRNFNMAWALMAGIAYDVSPNAKIDLGYRYVNLGKYTSTAKANSISEYRIGVRYMID